MSREIIGLCERADKWSTAYGASRTTEARFRSSRISPPSRPYHSPRPPPPYSRCITQNPRIPATLLTRASRNNIFYLLRSIRQFRFGFTYRCKDKILKDVSKLFNAFARSLLFCYVIRYITLIFLTRVDFES